jgi:hypothetical protein
MVRKRFNTFKCIKNKITFFKYKCKAFCWDCIINKQKKMKLAILIFLMLALAFSYDDFCGGNCPSYRCLTCPCGREPNKCKETASICAKNAKFWDQNCCKCIVFHESSDNSNAVNYLPATQTYKVGLFQIPSTFWGQCNEGVAPCNIDANLECAKQYYTAGGNNWSKWTTRNFCGC